MQKQAINPLTLKAPKPYPDKPLTMLRIGLMGQMYITVAIADMARDPENHPEAIESTTMLEREFVEALGHLFFRGELARCHLVEPISSHQEMHQRMIDLAAGRPCGETPLESLKATQLGVGTLQLEPERTIVNFVVSFFGQADRQPDTHAPAVLERLNALELEGAEIESFRGDRITVSFETPNEMTLRLPAVIAVITAALQETMSDDAKQPPEPPDDFAERW